MATKDRRLIKWIFILSLILNVAAAIYVGKKIYNRSQTKNEAAIIKKPVYHLNRDKVYEALPKDSNAIIFLGNSLTQYFELAELLQKPHIKNRGIHGDMIAGVLNRLSPIIATQPKKIFIEIGINDLEQKLSTGDLLNQYERLIDTLKARCTQTKIYVQSLLPVANSSQQLPGYCSPAMNKKIMEANVQLKELAMRKASIYIDIHSKLISNGELAASYSVDGVHLSGEGYLVWAKALEPYVNE